MFLLLLWCFVSLSLRVQQASKQFAPTYNDDAIVFDPAYQDNGVRFIEKPEKTLSFRKGYNYIESTSLFYKKHRTAVTWLDAVSKCQAEGAELALPNSRREVVALKMQFAQLANKVWLGLHDPVGNGNFQAVDETPANITNLFVNAVQTAAPRYAGNDKKCGAMNKNKHYENCSCDLELKFICSKRRSTIQYNPNCGSYKGYFLKPNALSCYKIHTAHRNWTQAFKTCREEHGSLVMVDSLEELNLYVKTMEDHPGSTKRRSYNNEIFWLGSCEHAGALQTDNGEPLVDKDYTGWARRPSEETTGNRHCCSLLRDGSHKFNNCGTMAMFFCEKSLTALNLNVDER